MRRIILLIGLPGAGKTTVLNELNMLYSLNVISPDEIRRQFGNTYGYDIDTDNYFFSNYVDNGLNDAVFKIAELQARWYLENKYHLPLVIDATNINPSFRKLWLKLAQEYNAKIIGVHLDVSLEEAISRNKDRQMLGKFAVPTSVIKSYYNKINLNGIEVYKFSDLQNSKITELFGAPHVEENFIAIGDIHGDYDSFIKLLDKMGIKIKNNIIDIPQKRSLIILGDFVDRGNDSLKLIKLFMATQKKNKNLIVLMGNHEYKLLRILNGEKILVRPGHIKTLSQFADLPLGYIKQIKKWLNTLPYVVKNHKFIFTHAAVLHGEYKNYTLQECIGFKRDVIINFRKYKGLYKLVCGHVYVKSDNEQLYDRHIYNLDKDEHGKNTIKALKYNELTERVVNPEDTYELYEVEAQPYNIEETNDYKMYIKYKTNYAPKSLVSINETSRYAIIKYTSKVHANPELFDKLTKEARGLVYDKWTGQFIVKAFKKFFNDTEDIDNLLQRLENRVPFDIRVKHNGFLFNITKLDDGTLFYSCNGSFGDEAPFVQLGKDIIDSNNYDFSNLKVNVTYMFEAIHPDDKHHVDYNGAKKLILLAKRKNNKIIHNIEKDATQIGCEYSKKVHLYEFLQIIREDFNVYKDEPFNLEGFVLYFADGYMTKVKLLSYLNKKFENVDTKRIINLRKKYIKVILDNYE